MWRKWLAFYILWTLKIIIINGHIPDYVKVPTNQVDQFCKLAESCVHDSISICGKMGEELRTFLDTCDLLEFACDKQQVYQHVDDMKGCPEHMKRPTV